MAGQCQGHKVKASRVNTRSRSLIVIYLFIDVLSLVPPVFDRPTPFHHDLFLPRRNVSQFFFHLSLHFLLFFYFLLSFFVLFFFLQEKKFDSRLSCQFYNVSIWMIKNFAFRLFAIFLERRLNKTTNII